jgi:5,5'-dehydrodivanillate O-demethylase
MSVQEQLQRRGDRLNLLTQTSAGTEMGELLRTFWHPVAIAHKLLPGKANRIRAFGEDLAIYRGDGGKPHLVGDRCAHRRTLLHTGWVEGDEIRCMYHGWKYDGTGQCTERPAENDTHLPKVKIAGYPCIEYGDLIFTYMGKGEPPSFDLNRKDVCERADGVTLGRIEVWNCNWFQMVENAMDAVHVSFVHQKGRIGRFGESVKANIPELEYVETEAGIRQTATRGPGNVRVSDWTFPNNNHISVPGPLPGDPWIDVCSWKVPIDDFSTMRFNIWSTPGTNLETDRRIRQYLEKAAEYNPADSHDALFDADEYPSDPVFGLTSAQDYVAQMGQGVITDREGEMLGRSDAGIALMRRIFFREMAALRSGSPPKAWAKLKEDAHLPVQTG